MRNLPPRPNEVERGPIQRGLSTVAHSIEFELWGIEEETELTAEPANRGKCRNEMRRTDAPRPTSRQRGDINSSCQAAIIGNPAILTNRSGGNYLYYLEQILHRFQLFLNRLHQRL